MIHIRGVEMRVFVTGGTGHLGAWLVKALAAQGNAVVVGVRDEKKADFLRFPNVEIVRADLDNIEALKSHTQNCDAIFHLGAFAAVWAKDPSIFYKTNVEGTRNVLEAAKANHVKRVVVVSSAGNFGPSIDGTVTENTVRKLPFFNDYERTKNAADELALEYIKNGLDVVIVYPTRVYGPVLNGKPASLTMLVHRSLTAGFRIVPGKGDKIGNYVFIDDVIQGFILAWQKGRKGEKYILGGENLTLKSVYLEIQKNAKQARKLLYLPLSIIRIFLFVEKVGSWFGRPPVLTQDWLAKVIYDWNLSSDKARTELGYSTTPLEIGMQKTAEWAYQFSEPS